MFSLSSRSKNRLGGVHPDLVKVVKRAIEITSIDFAVIEGLRSIETQRRYVAEGKSKTLNSRHLTGHAVDLAPYAGGRISWEPRHFIPLAKAMKQAAAELGVPLEWGGDWKGGWDKPHFALPRKQYPATVPAEASKDRPADGTPDRLIRSKATAGAVTGGGVAAASMVEPLQRFADSVDNASWSMSSGTIISIIVGVIGIAAAGLVLYAKWDDLKHSREG